jgi:stearoyl-CoA desaturase (delta-9 desaturase)
MINTEATKCFSNILNMDSYKQTLYVVWSNQVLFLASMTLYFEWHLLLISIISMYIFGFMSESSVHRYFSHKSYETTNLKEKLLLVFAFLTGQGAVLSWVAVHRSHHAFEDTKDDPHSPQFIPKWKLYLGLFPKKKYRPSLVTDLIKSNNSKYLLFENKYYWLLWTVVWVISFLINFYLFFFIVSGSALWYIVTETVNIFAHSKEGKKTDLRAVGINSSWLNLLSGAGNHNNHHSNPKSYTYKVTNEIDVHAYLIRIFLKNDKPKQY